MAWYGIILPKYSVLRFVFLCVHEKPNPLGFLRYQSIDLITVKQPEEFVLINAAKSLQTVK